MNITTRPAEIDDLGELERLYRELELEQNDLKAIWSSADGLSEPVEASLKSLLEDPDSIVLFGELDDISLGFIWARVEDLLPQADGQRLGVIRLIYVEHEARGVGIGHEMIEAALAEMRSRGVTLFDAKVLPGHRHAKNFFEAHGFSARLIFMHHEDSDE